MSVTSEQFFRELQDGETWCSCFIYESQMEYIPESVKMYMCINEIRQQNDNFKDDEIHKELVKDLSKAKRALRNYEYNVNHNFKKS